MHLRVRESSRFSPPREQPEQPRLVLALPVAAAESMCFEYEVEFGARDPGAAGFPRSRADAARAGISRTQRPGTK